MRAFDANCRSQSVGMVALVDVALVSDQRVTIGQFAWSRVIPAMSAMARRLAMVQRRRRICGFHVTNVAYSPLHQNCLVEAYGVALMKCADIHPSSGHAGQMAKQLSEEIFLGFKDFRVLNVESVHFTGNHTGRSSQANL